MKDPASIDVSKGWCRLMGLVPISLFLACALVVRNLAISDAFTERALEGQRRQARRACTEAEETPAPEFRRPACWLAVIT